MVDCRVRRFAGEVARTGDVSIIPKWLTFDKIDRATNPFLHGHYRAGDDQSPQAEEASPQRKTIDSRATRAIESPHTSNKNVLAPDLKAGKS